MDPQCTFSVYWIVDGNSTGQSMRNRSSRCSRSVVRSSTTAPQRQSTTGSGFPHQSRQPSQLSAAGVPSSSWGTSSYVTAISIVFSSSLATAVQGSTTTLGHHRPSHIAASSREPPMTPGNRYEAFISGFDDQSRAQRIYEWVVETFYVAADTSDEITSNHSLDVASFEMSEDWEGIS